MRLPILDKKEFHISRQSRDLYQFDQSLFSLSGNVIFANFHAARVFAQKLNARRNLVRFPESAVRASQVNAMGLIDEILHLVIQRYREQVDPLIMGQAFDWLAERIGSEELERVLYDFADQFPPLAVYRRTSNLEAYLDGESILEDGQVVSNRHIVLEELILLWLANANPAFAPYLELFDDSQLEKRGIYPQIIQILQDFFANQPYFGPDDQNLIEMLRSPAIAVPHSLTGQLEYIRERWGYLLEKHLFRLLSSLDLIKEEEKIRFGLGPGPTYVYDYSALDLETERFSPDRDWMPSLVLIAKNAYVWLDQLSKKYSCQISHLDQIPGEELDTLAAWGFSGLWLIGVWERSKASKRIKQIRGNPEAEASAYSLHSYEVAADLGGDEALSSLQKRAWERGIRLASDMVPNHMGIDSRWVIEHPDWFISLDHSPFPSYSFNGPNLSWDDRVGIYLEDHYYDGSDAAVVFKRRDTWTNDEKYIYHGNDGTSMPWNDTAQLNYLLNDVREAVIQTILHVARKFPIIRFDAAMTLAKRHYQRLWFPEPGSGGDIPSRAENGLSRDDFNNAFPIEFWRDVVDRVAIEVPDTLLLAEAFWLMEGYFVRTLGMHRVYNSAFMNMLRDEKNLEYRLVIKNTLEFDPEILKRYVNFMNNPDERTAVEQFGKGDKYFGICILMATMPGLPMFGHGQIEGFTEKYGMEFRRAYWDEQTDRHLVERHEREIFPLLRRRYLFSGVENFLLYDFYTSDGAVSEDVFAYSNRVGDERALVVYHNKYAQSRGWVRLSTAYLVKEDGGNDRRLVQKTLGEGLALMGDSDLFTLFRDHISGMEYIRSSQELHQKGFYVELEAYKAHVFLDFRQVRDDEWRSYAQLAEYLDGRGVPNIEEARKEITLWSVHRPFHELVNPGSFYWLIDHRATRQQLTSRTDTLEQALEVVGKKTRHLFEGANILAGGNGETERLAESLTHLVGIILALPDLESEFSTLTAQDLKASLEYLRNGPDGENGLESGEPSIWGPLLSWAFTCKLGEIKSRNNCAEYSRSWIDEWLLGKIIAQTLVELGFRGDSAWRMVSLLRWLIGDESLQDEPMEMPHQLLESWLSDLDVQRFLMVHRYQGVLWFNKEAFESLLWWYFTTRVVRACHISTEGDIPPMERAHLAEPGSPDPSARILYYLEIVQELLKAQEVSGYQVEKLLDAARS